MRDWLSQFFNQTRSYSLWLPSLLKKEEIEVSVLVFLFKKMFEEPHLLCHLRTFAFVDGDLADSPQKFSEVSKGETIHVVWPLKITTQKTHEKSLFEVLSRCSHPTPVMMLFTYMKASFQLIQINST